MIGHFLWACNPSQCEILKAWDIQSKWCLLPMPLLACYRVRMIEWQVACRAGWEDGEADGLNSEAVGVCRCNRGTSS